MTLGLSASVVALLVLVVVVGATMQGLVGLGLNLVSAPVVTMVAPSLMPELPLVLAVLLPFFTLARERDQIDWGGLGWVLSARVPGTALGVLLLALFSDRALAIAVAMMVLLAVLLTVRSVEVPVRPATLSTAGVLSGLAGTTTSIGGPPVAILYQHRPPAQIRATLAVLFTVGAAMSLVGIWLSGHLDTHALPLAVVLTPCLFVGAWVGNRLQGVFPERQMRYAVLAVCAASAIVLLVRSLLG
ncbi:MAG: sulfite exporter TauE/SafE family protein [Marmoricola sp.]